MEINQDTPVMPVFFTSRHNEDLTKSCLLFLRTELPDMERAVVSLSVALTQWATSTEEGGAFLKECQYNVSIADIAATAVFDNRDLRRIMREQGLEFVACHGTYCEPNIHFDRVLIDSPQWPGGSDLMQSSEVPELASI